MATKKPKATKTTVSKSAKPKTAAKTVEKPVSEAPKTNPAKAEKKSCFKGFFAKKYEENESVLTIFKNPKFYGALLGEVLGTALLAAFLLSAMLLGGVVSISSFFFALVAILIAVYAFSGACLNPLITVGMMASRRMSVIRGVMYIIAEVIGAWLGWVIINSFHLAGGTTAVDLKTLAAIGENQFWLFAMVELLGAIIIAFMFARALKYKRSVFTFGVTVAGGVMLAIVLGYVVSAGFLGLSDNFVFNPAVALMSQIFPTTGDNFGEIMSGICQALTVFVLFPAVGGVCGFYLSDFASKLSGEE